MKRRLLLLALLLLAVMAVPAPVARAESGIGLRVLTAPSVKRNEKFRITVQFASASSWPGSTQVHLPLDYRYLEVRWVRSSPDVRCYLMRDGVTCDAPISAVTRRVQVEVRVKKTKLPQWFVFQASGTVFSQHYTWSQSEKVYVRVKGGTAK